jgi:DNA-binding response OmpR family regulator
MTGYYALCLDGFGDLDHRILSESIQMHYNKVEIASEAGDADIILTSDMIPNYPLKMGVILDQVDALMSQSRYPDVINAGIYRLHRDSKAFFIEGESPVALSDRESTLMAELILAGDAGVSRDILLDVIWGFRADLETHALETQIYRLRQKIEGTPDNPKHIITIDGGYRLG